MTNATQGDKGDRAKILAIWFLRLTTVVLSAGVLLSTLDFNQWWIRAWDFPRAQLLAIMLFLSAALWQFDRSWRPWLPLALIGLCLWQAWRIYPYTPLSPSEVAFIDRSGPNVAEACFSVLSLNVLQDNRNYQRTLAMIEQSDPDILLLMETDQAWVDALGSVDARYDTVLAHPLDNKYGLYFATRLPTKGLQIRDLAQKDTPSVTGTLEIGQHQIFLTGLHPRPPSPGQDTEERDAELVLAARLAADRNLPAIAIGDFNDVAWSDTTRLFMQTGKYLDPRIGRGTYATFPADMTWLGWPLDHLFVTDEFFITRLEVLDEVGSDHRPILAALCLDPAAARTANAAPDPNTADSQAEATEVIDEFAQDSAEDRAKGD